MSASLLSAASLATLASARHRHRSTRRAPRTVAAASGGHADDSPMETESFTAPMLTNVRARVTGFDTTMSVSKLPTEDALVNERKPSEGDLVSVVFSAQTQDGELLQSMEDMEEPITFEVGGLYNSNPVGP
jgi:hypothetical protein